MTETRRPRARALLSVILAAGAALPRAGTCVAADTEAFLAAVRSGDTAAVERALRLDPALAQARDAKGISALLVAHYHQKPEIARLLLAAGFELDIFEAAASGRAERVRSLLAREPALANAFAPDGFTPLGLAVFFADRATVEALLAGGARADLQARNAMRAGPIHAAAARNKTDIARLLLARGADPNARQQEGFTALHEAAAAGRLELARLLVEKGADVNAKTDAGKTAVALATELAQPEMAAFLRARGGNR